MVIDPRVEIVLNDIFVEKNFGGEGLMRADCFELSQAILVCRPLTCPPDFEEIRASLFSLVGILLCSMCV